MIRHARLRGHPALFLPGLEPGGLYKYEIVGRDGRQAPEAEDLGFAR